MLLGRIIAIVLGFQVMLNITRPLISLYAVDLGAGTFQIGAVTAAYAFFPLVFAIRMGKLADRVGDRIPVVIGTVGIALGTALPFVWPSMPSLYASQAIVGISQILINISLQNVLGNAATKENRDHFFSMFSMAVAMGGVIGPVVGGYLAEHVSYPFAFLVSACVGLLPIALSFSIPVIIRSKDKSGKTG
jgi:MFS family permease